MKIHGCDISKWQKDAPHGFDFTVIRATHGNMIDPVAEHHYRNADGLKGFYSFAKTNQNWLTCAKLFVRYVSRLTGGNEPVFLALDIEGTDAKRANAREWVRNWLAYIIRVTGIKPLLYVQSSLIPQYAEIMNNLDVGLWVAHWGVSKPRTTPLKTWAMWQYSDSKGKLDVDYFNGTKEQLRKYMGKVKDIG